MACSLFALLIRSSFHFTMTADNAEALPNHIQPKRVLSSRKLVLPFTLSVAPRGSSRIFDLIAENDWETLEIYMRSTDARISIAKMITNHRDQTPLHLTCQLNAPLPIVRQMVEACSGAVVLKDATGRTPLHMAVAYKAALDIIKLLICKNSSVASMTDYQGKTPLMLLCQNCATRSKLAGFHSDSATCQNEEDMRATISYPLMKIAKVLCKASPQAVVVEDANGVTALEVAICANAELRMVKYLQSLSIHIMRVNQNKPETLQTNKVYRDGFTARRSVPTRKMPQPHSIKTPQQAVAKLESILCDDPCEPKQTRNIAYKQVVPRWIYCQKVSTDKNNAATAFDQNTTAGLGKIGLYLV